MANPNIFQQYLKPPRSISEYSADMDKAEMGQMELATGRMKMNEARRGEQEKNALRALLAGGGDIKDQASVLRVAPTVGPAVLKQFGDLEKQRADIGHVNAQTTRLGTQSQADVAGTAEKHLKAIQFFAGGVLANPTPENAMVAANSFEAFTGKKLSEQQRQQIAQLQTPDQVRQWASGLSLQAKDLLPKIMPAMNTGQQTVISAFSPVTAQVIPGAGATFQNGVSPNTIANNEAQAPLRAAQTQAAMTGAQSTAARASYETPTQIPVPGMAAPVIPSPSQSNGGFPRISPQQQSGADQQAIQIIAQKYASNPSEMARIDQSIQQATAAMQSAPVEARGMLQREINGMLAAKQMANGVAAPAANPAASLPSTAKARDAMIAAEGKNNPSGKPLPSAALKMQQEELDAIGISASLKSDIAALNKQINSGQLELGPISNVIGEARNYTGLSNQNSRNLASFKATLEKIRNDSLKLNKGVQTEGDAVRAWNEVLKTINDPKLVMQRLSEIEAINQRAVNLRKMNIDTIRRNYGHQSLETSQFENQPATVGAPPPGAVRRIN